MGFGRKAFTLIELLIVVAIIAILALIAVPNFLEAQVRAKVSRCKSDMRSIAVAWEAYRVDWNCYPRDQDNWVGPGGGGALENGYTQITTPVAYITSIPFDPFFTAYSMNPAHGDPSPGEPGISYAPHYEVASAVITDEPYDCFCISGVGPDRRDDFGGNDNWPDGGELWAYDPTNGTISMGDIMRFGGSYRAGHWDYNGVPWQYWSHFGD